MIPFVVAAASTRCLNNRLVKMKIENKYFILDAMLHDNWMNRCWESSFYVEASGQRKSLLSWFQHFDSSEIYMLSVSLMINDSHLISKITKQYMGHYKWKDYMSNERKQNAPTTIAPTKFEPESTWR